MLLNCWRDMPVLLFSKHNNKPQKKRSDRDTQELVVAPCCTHRRKNSKKKRQPRELRSQLNSDRTTGGISNTGQKEKKKLVDNKNFPLQDKTKKGRVTASRKPSIQTSHSFIRKQQEKKTPIVINTLRGYMQKNVFHEIKPTKGKRIYDPSTPFLPTSQRVAWKRS